MDPPVSSTPPSPSPRTSALAAAIDSFLRGHLTQDQACAAIDQALEQGERLDYLSMRDARDLARQDAVGVVAHLCARLPGDGSGFITEVLDGALETPALDIFKLASAPPGGDTPWWRGQRSRLLLRASILDQRWPVRPLIEAGLDWPRGMRPDAVATCDAVTLRYLVDTMARAGQSFKASDVTAAIGLPAGPPSPRLLDELIRAIGPNKASLWIHVSGELLAHCAMPLAPWSRCIEVMRSADCFIPYPTCVLGMRACLDAGVDPGQIKASDKAAEVKEITRFGLPAKPSSKPETDRVIEPLTEHLVALAINGVDINQCARGDRTQWPVAMALYCAGADLEVIGKVLTEPEQSLLSETRNTNLARISSSRLEVGTHQASPASTRRRL